VLAEALRPFFVGRFGCSVCGSTQRPCGRSQLRPLRARPLPRIGPRRWVQDCSLFNLKPHLWPEAG
jgi:hypothetical protein